MKVLVSTEYLWRSEEITGAFDVREADFIQRSLRRRVHLQDRRGRIRHVGSYAQPSQERGARSPLIWCGRNVGTVLRTRSHVKPVFVSPGHSIDVDTAARVVLGAALGYRVPEPVRRAHVVATRGRRDVTRGIRG